MVGKHKPYLRVSDDQKAVTGKHASKHGIVNAMNPLRTRFSEKESTVHGWKKAYLLELFTWKKSEGEITALC